MQAIQSADGAFASISDCLAAVPHHPFCLKQGAAFYASKQDLTHAVLLLENPIAIDPDNGRNYLPLAEFYEISGRRESSKATYAQACGLGIDSACTRVNELNQ